MTESSEAARRLNDMLVHIDEALAIVGDTDFPTYQASLMMRRAAERCIEIVSEASKHIPDSIKEAHPDVPWPKIRAIGNVFRHQYSDVDDHAVWRTVKVSLAELRPTIENLLKKRGPGR